LQSPFLQSLFLQSPFRQSPSRQSASCSRSLERRRARGDTDFTDLADWTDRFVLARERCALRAERIPGVRTSWPSRVPNRCAVRKSFFTEPAARGV